jgi:hypothetical protein
MRCVFETTAARCSAGKASLAKWSDKTKDRDMPEIPLSSNACLRTPKNRSKIKTLFVVTAMVLFQIFPAFCYSFQPMPPGGDLRESAWLLDCIGFGNPHKCLEA